MADKLIQTPDSPQLEELCKKLAELSKALDQGNSWPEEQLDLCGKYGVYRWFLPVERGGFDWNEAEVIQGYLKLSQACLTTTFIITQRTGACKRILTAQNDGLKDELLPDLASGEAFATVGISHLTTSRRHLSKPVLTAEETDNGFLLNGFSPWVTGGMHADHIVIGATCDDGRQLLVAMPTDLSGVSVSDPAQLVGLTSSHTGKVSLENVLVDQKWLIDGPLENVMSGGAGGNTGGLQTSTLAVGLATAAVEFIALEAERREDLIPPLEALRTDCDTLRADLLHTASGETPCSPEELRRRANSLALRASQAALSAAKGAGYVVGHPAGRWCREALFFLVWSCPQPVMQANLCELAGLGDHF